MHRPPCLDGECVEKGKRWKYYECTEAMRHVGNFDVIIFTYFSSELFLSATYTTNVIMQSTAAHLRIPANNFIGNNKEIASIYISNALPGITQRNQQFTNARSNDDHTFNHY